MKRYNRIAKSLCAVILALALLLPMPVSRADEVVSDKYSLTVEFGSLSFYYDHGVWDPNLMNYVASSTDPTAAEGTTAGLPGWYGFDGTANKITVTNTSLEPMTVTLSLSFRPLTTGDGITADKIVSGVSMSVVNPTAADTEKWIAVSGSYEVALAQSDTAVALIHLQGMPTLPGGGRWISENEMAPIGMLILKIKDWRNP